MDISSTSCTECALGHPPQKDQAMTHVSVSYVYPVHPDRAWALLGNPASLADWHPAIQSSTTEGATRRCTLADGGEVVETILELDDAARQYKYSIDSSPLPIRDYVSLVSVTPNDSGCQVTWESDFAVIGAPTEQIEAAIRGLYEAGLTELRSLLDAEA